ncbi:MAG: hypothetical protein H0T75_19660, partial [Rhizobiales bacterium]|nr:hypothetical protein [Hyphomicrobiales bacterium]
TVLGTLEFDDKGDVSLPGYVFYEWEAGKYNQMSDAGGAMDAAPADAMAPAADAMAPAADAMAPAADAMAPAEGAEQPAQ